jgi:hypothetical protein
MSIAFSDRWRFSVTQGSITHRFVFGGTLVASMENRPLYNRSALLFDTNQIRGADLGGRCALVEGTTQAPERCDICNSFNRFRGSRHG